MVAGGALRTNCDAGIYPPGGARRYLRAALARTCRNALAHKPRIDRSRGNSFRPRFPHCSHVTGCAPHVPDMSGRLSGMLFKQFQGFKFKYSNAEAANGPPARSFISHDSGDEMGFPVTYTAQIDAVCEPRTRRQSYCRLTLFVKTIMRRKCADRNMPTTANSTGRSCAYRLRRNGR